MYKLLKIMVPSIQVVALCSVFVLAKVVHDEKWSLLYVLPARQLVLNLNFPLVVISSLIVYVGSFTRNFNLSWQPEGATLIAGLIGAALVAIASVATFWYLVVREIQLRRQGQSLLYSSSGMLVWPRILILVVLGIAALYRACSQTIWPVQHQLWRHGLWPLELIFGDLVLATWAAAFLVASVFDFRRFAAERRSR